MEYLKQIIRRTPVIRELALFLLRCRIASSYLGGQTRSVLRWIGTSKEYANFTYDLSDLNKRYLASLVSLVTRVDLLNIMSYINELETDVALRAHIDSAVQNSEQRYFSDKTVSYGRRLGWYVLARVIKPKVIVETGVDKGMGSCVLTAALMRNATEGFPGYYYGTDINPAAGYLLSGVYASYGKIYYEDSLTTLRRLDVEIDLFINDSDHSSQYEEQEYEVIKSKLNHASLILSDNAHVTDRLFAFAEKTGRKFVYFQEQPANHWYPGAGIGIAFNE